MWSLKVQRLVAEHVLILSSVILNYNLGCQLAPSSVKGMVSLTTRLYATQRGVYEERS